MSGNITPLKITSISNAKFKALMNLHDSKGAKQSQQALVCGEKIILDLIAACPHRFKAIVVDDTRLNQGQELVRRVSVQPAKDSDHVNCTLWQLERDLFRRADLFGTGKAMAILECNDLVAPISALHECIGGQSAPDMMLSVLPLQHPDNLGAAVRSALALASPKIILSKESCYPFHPKAIRASSGAVFRARFFVADQWQTILDLESKNFTLYALDALGQAMDSCSIHRRAALICGVEGPGLPDAIRDKVLKLAIPMNQEVESLNATQAFSIALYEYARQGRRNSGPPENLSV